MRPLAFLRAAFVLVMALLIVSQAAPPPATLTPREALVPPGSAVIEAVAGYAAGHALGGAVPVLLGGR
jgi:hypothetical protein